MKNKSYLLQALVGTTAVAAVAAIAIGRRSKYPGIKLKKSIIVDKTPEELYLYWRDFKNLPAFMDFLHSVDVFDNRHSHWTLAGPAGMHLSWDAIVTVDRKNEMIAWKSYKNSAIDTAGYVRFERAAGGRGTLVRLALQYNPPAGKMGVALSSLLGKRPQVHIEDALRRFKQLMET